MTEIKFLTIVALLVVVCIVPERVHPGAELSPILQELESVKTKFRTDIDNLDQRLNEHVDDVHGLNGKTLEEFIQTVVDNSVGDSLTNTVEEMNELKLQIESLVSNDELSNGSWIGGSVAGGITGAITGFIAGLVSRLIRRNRKVLLNNEPELGSSSKNTSDLPPQVPSVGASFVGPVNTTAKTNDEDKKSSIETRVVTQTTKEHGTNRILALHNPSAEWSPRTKEEAIADILEGHISYIARGPEGNLADVEVRHPRDGSPYLRTKPDEHGGNNLADLPDPT